MDHDNHHLSYHEPEDELYVIAVLYDNDVMTKAMCPCVQGV